MPEFLSMSFTISTLLIYPEFTTLVAEYSDYDESIDLQEPDKK